MRMKKAFSAGRSAPPAAPPVNVVRSKLTTCLMFRLRIQLSPTAQAKACRDGLRRVHDPLLEGLRPDLDAVHTARELEGAPLPLAGLEGLARAHARERRLLAGEGERSGRLPRLAAEPRARPGRGLLHPRLRPHVLRHEPEAARVEGELRREAMARAVGRDAGHDRQEADLAARAIRRQGAGLLAGGAGDPEAQALEGRASPLEGGEEETPRHVLAVVDVEVDAAAVGGAVEDPGRVRHDAAREVAVEHHPDVAVGDERRRVGTLDERECRGRLEPLEADRRLELADADAELRRVVDVEPGVLQHRRATPKSGMIWKSKCRPTVPRRSAAPAAGGRCPSRAGPRRSRRSGRRTARSRAAAACSPRSTTAGRSPRLPP